MKDLHLLDLRKICIIFTMYEVECLILLKICESTLSSHHGYMQVATKLGCNQGCKTGSLIYKC